jgi:hypothetical protein
MFISFRDRSSMIKFANVIVRARVHTHLVYTRARTLYARLIIFPKSARAAIALYAAGIVQEEPLYLEIPGHLEQQETD